MRIATFTYDSTRALHDGTFTVDGTRVETAPTVPDIFRGLLDGTFDVAELGLTFLLRAREQEPPDDHTDELVMIPAFPARVFRHSCVFVHADSGIRGPEDLRGRTIGEFGTYGQDSGVWAKGALADDHGFRPETNRWVIGGLDRPAPPFAFTSHPHPADVEVTPTDRALGDLLETGEIDALFTANVPQVVLDGSPHVRRLFPDHERVEQDWFRRTGIFPMMHAVAARRSVLDAHPGLATAVYESFLAAKDAAEERYRHDARWYEIQHLLPWTNALLERTRALLGEDWWPYGVARNRHALDTFLRYHHEQGLSARRWSVEELVAPELLTT